MTLQLTVFCQNIWSRSIDHYLEFQIAARDDEQGENKWRWYHSIWKKGIHLTKQCYLDLRIT